MASKSSGPVRLRRRQDGQVVQRRSEFSLFGSAIVDLIAHRIYSIVFLHGLNGDRVKTWTGRGVFWPRDLLPLKLERCRIMTFGYNADLGFSSSTLSLRDFAISLLSGLRDEREANDVSLLQETKSLPNGRNY